MDDSEGRDHNTYALAELPVVKFLVGRRQFVPLYTYVNVFRGVMIRNGNPVSLRSTSQKRARQLLATATEGQPEAVAEWTPQAIPRIQPSISATFLSPSVKLGLKNRSRPPSTSL